MVSILWVCSVTAPGLPLSLTVQAAEATEGEHELWAGLDAESTPRFGLSGQYRYAWTDFWAVGATLQHRHGWRGGSAAGLPETAAFLDARLTLDALTWVPSVVVGLGAATDWETLQLRVSAAGVLAYRPARDWSVKVRVGVEQSLIDSAPRPFLSFSYGWLRGAASELDF